jgi:hypothetical protein
MAVLFAVSWPIEFSFDLWVFKDRGCFLNLDYMLDEHLRLGVDTYYAYGLLPVLLQRGLFAIFGRGPWPLIGCHAVYILLAALAWTLIIQQLSNPRFWAIIVIALCAIVVWVNPNLPYVLVQLSLLYSIAFLLRRQYSAALAVSAVGCWSVPTVTLVASALLAALIVLDWALEKSRNISGLVGALLPGGAAYLGMGLGLAGFFGLGSVLATALPFQGMAFYKATNLGMFTSLKSFLFGDDLTPALMFRHYFFDRATWWMFGSGLLVGLTLYGAALLVKGRRVNPAHATVVFCGTVHTVFAIFAYGTSGQHVIYDPLIVAGVIIGLDQLPPARLRTILIGVFIALGALGEVNQAGNARYVWKTTRATPQSANFYSPAPLADAWSEVVAMSQKRRTLALSYGTGIRHYFPTIDNADVWTLQTGQVFEADKQRLLIKIRNADVIAEDLNGPMGLFETDPDIKSELGGLCPIEKNSFVAIWSRPPAGAACEPTAGLPAITPP